MYINFVYTFMKLGNIVVMIPRYMLNLGHVDTNTRSSAQINEIVHKILGNLFSPIFIVLGKIFVFMISWKSLNWVIYYEK